MAGTKTRSTLQRFWAKVDRRGPNECWEWRGARNTNSDHGHFLFSAKPTRRLVMAYRVMWWLAVGRIPDGMNVCHRCDNPKCVNPAHLFLGTQADNLRDMREKRRHAHGETNGHARLTRGVVEEIRALARSGSMTQAAIAQQFGVDQSHVSNIKHGYAWKHTVEGAA